MMSTSKKKKLQKQSQYQNHIKLTFYDQSLFMFPRRENYKPRDLRTIFSEILLNSSLFSRHILAASTFAPLSSLGSEKVKKISTK